jgi:flagellin FlaB
MKRSIYLRSFTEHTLPLADRGDHLKGIVKMNRKGEMGIGTMILFIAMVLVAAVAAALLISTAGSLNQQAQETGRLAQDDVSSGFVVEQVLGVKNRAYWTSDWDGSDDDGLLIIAKDGGQTSVTIDWSDAALAVSVDVSVPNFAVAFVDGTTTADAVADAINGDSTMSQYVTAYAEGDGSGAMDTPTTTTWNAASAVSDGTDDGDDQIGDLYLKVRLNAGSPKLDMDNVVINVMSDSFEASLTYEESGSDNYYQRASNSYYTIETPDLDPGYHYGDWASPTGGTANGGVVRDPDGYYGDASSDSGAHIVSQGTMLMIHLNVDFINGGTDAGGGLASQDALSVTIIPKHGAATTEIVNIPESLIYTYNVLS